MRDMWQARSSSYRLVREKLKWQIGDTTNTNVRALHMYMRVASQMHEP